MIDPLAEMVSLLQPQAAFSKRARANGRWRVQRSETGQPFYCLVLEGRSQLKMKGHPPITLEEGDFVLIPAAWEFCMTSAEPPADDAPESTPQMLAPGEFWIGDQQQPADVQTLIGYCQFGAPDAGLIVSLLPQFIHVRGESRLTTLVQLVMDECRAQRPARHVVLERLLELLLIEALRSMPICNACPGVMSGLADERLAAAIRAIHANPAHSWTVAELAKAAALSRSSFFVRFREAVGVAPMVYLLTWRMALAKNLLRGKSMAVAEVAERVGYRSASAFSVAFSRYVGQPPAWFAAEEDV
ncbi:transcriptional regulator, AraC family [Candidatus Pantoea symbiotica]|jgi:AraC-like DNA-binding protein|uniref:Transcriptional regulator, AraC family n=1 Tax=Candidatus Pantoea symbiotica TaxID=1884370 RepID=A0A1I3ZWM8_9GAMM|nr:MULTISPECIES: AraC family transcriptional regulator [Pantoea]KAJ9430146.1 AraC family transcriptional regulator [Pantoea sp. YR343]MRT25803.1 helix-turn-helix domain-containing protein [Enterobacteriaceae bacterium RIT697]SFK47929.1 transcriptional regulator, AraC family [Pantoea symbiotica]SFU91724.1 transcriptional regulator, AraC family [Pantoea sp. YR525]